MNVPLSSLFNLYRVIPPQISIITAGLMADRCPRVLERQVPAQTRLLSEQQEERAVLARITRVTAALPPLREPPNRPLRSRPCTKTTSLKDPEQDKGLPLVSTARASDRRRTSARLKVEEEEETSTTALLIPHRWPEDRTTAMKVMKTLCFMLLSHVIGINLNISFLVRI